MQTPSAATQTPRPNTGPHRDEDAALRILVDRLVQGLHPQAIYLFGSRAEGRARPDSDFDLVVVFDDEAPEASITYEAAYAPICGSGIGCDVVPCRAAELTEVLGDPTNPWHLAWRNALRVYERD